MITAFQSNAFQNNAFQIGVVADTGITQSKAGGSFSRRNVHLYRSSTRRTPHPVYVSAATAREHWQGADQHLAELKAREPVPARELKPHSVEPIEVALLRLENLGPALFLQQPQQLQREHDARKRRQDDEAIALLLLS